MDPRAVPSEQEAFVPANTVGAGNLLLPLARQGPDGAAHAHTGAHLQPARFGYERFHILLRREGWRVGKNRVRRLYVLPPTSFTSLVVLP